MLTYEREQVSMNIVMLQLLSSSYLAWLKSLLTVILTTYLPSIHLNVILWSEFCMHIICLHFELCLVSSDLCDFIILALVGDLYKSRNFSVCNILNFPLTASSLVPLSLYFQALIVFPQIRNIQHTKCLAVN
jgi:hypothetical protein